MKTIEVDYKRLVEFIYEKCPHHFYNFAEGHCCVRKVNAQTCELHTFARELSCPHDCPRLNTKEYACDMGRCPRVKAIIKELKA